MISFRTKLAALVSVTVVAAVLLASMAAATRDASRRFSAKQSELQGIAGVIAMAVSAPLQHADANAVARALSSVGRIPHVTYAEIKDRDGNVVHQFGFGIVVETGRKAEANVQLTPWSGSHLKTYLSSQPVVFAGETIGMLTLIADLSPLESAVTESFVSALLAGLLAASAAMIVTWKFQNQLADPILRLTHAMQRIAVSKDYKQHVAKAGGGEVGVMVDAFNVMMDEVSSRDGALARHQARLEIEVLERTSQLATAKASAETANAAKSEFLAAMSHEIRTPLNGMLVMAELMATAELPTRLRRNADVLVTSGQSLLAIINDILDLSKVEAGKLELECTPVAVRDVIDDVVSLFGQRAETVGLDLVVGVAPNVPETISADALRLKQVLSNLVNNALKFTEKGGVSIRASFDGAARTMTLAVTDTGIGIPAAKLDTIFEAFSQADQTVTRRFGGTGIGLTICRRLAQAMAGKITVTSVPGEGSTFALQWPVDVLADAPQAPALAATLDRQVVLMLPAGLVRDALCEALESAGFIASLHDEAAKPANGIRALVGYPQQLPTLAVDNASRPLVFAIASSRDSAAQALLEHGGADRVLNLPLTSQDLKELIEQLATPGQVRRASEARRSSVAAIDHGLTGRRVLIADDTAVNREVLAEALQRLGVTSVAVVNGEQAVAAITSASGVAAFDLVLMDCSMPTLDGFGATRAIRAWEREQKMSPLPIVALTAHIFAPDATEWREAGMTDYLAKPFTLKSLSASLKAHLQAQPLLQADTEQRVQPAERVSPQTSHRAHTEPVLDRQILDDIRDMQPPGEDLVARIIGLFITHAPPAADALTTAARADDCGGIAETAHALLSMSRNMGAARLSELCAGCEAAARAGDLPGAKTWLGSLDRDLEEAIAALRVAGAASTVADHSALRVA